ncbi:YceI family protein [Amniculibacterium aquaticum]|jgi:polyisoprenoid-binding protein YceI|uniref:YceI family protein n=1 Tax=Amniculibacterium aquaticum TaxID=2479858 RepID=UPI000F5A8A9F|nr:YceI family protein [Amniculibacterium aquaticum]
MHSFKNLTAALLLISGLAFGQANKKIQNSTITWKAYKALNADAMSHWGTVKLKAGNIVTNSNNEIVGGNFIIDLSTILADDMKGNKKMKLMLENHLKSDDFFDVKNFPTAFFKLTTVKPNNDKKYNYIFSGNLTIRNVSKPISFPVFVSNDGNKTTVQSALFTFNRKDYDLNYNIFEDMILKNEVEMTVKFMAK